MSLGYFCSLFKTPTEGYPFLFTHDERRKSKLYNAARRILDSFRTAYKQVSRVRIVIVERLDVHTVHKQKFTAAGHVC